MYNTNPPDLHKTVLELANIQHPENKNTFEWCHAILEQLSKMLNRLLVGNTDTHHKMQIQKSVHTELCQQQFWFHSCYNASIIIVWNVQYGFLFALNAIRTLLITEMNSYLNISRVLQALRVYVYHKLEQ